MNRSTTTAPTPAPQAGQADATERRAARLIVTSIALVSVTFGACWTCYFDIYIQILSCHFCGIDNLLNKWVTHNVDNKADSEFLLISLRWRDRTPCSDCHCRC
jgi:hypothetical protein